MGLFFISAYRRITTRFRFTLIRVRIEKKQSKPFRGSPSNLVVSPFSYLIKLATKFEEPQKNYILNFTFILL